MAQKLWEKNVQVDQEVDTFTVGKDREMDLYLAKYDVLGSLAHITMLESINLLTADELKELTAALREIYNEVEEGKFVIEDGIEDPEFKLVSPEGFVRLNADGKLVFATGKYKGKLLKDLINEDIKSIENGGAKAQRERALRNYYLNPNYCKYCNKQGF